MIVLLIDKDNNEQDLIDEGYQLQQIQQAKQFLVQRFRLYAKMIFTHVLEKPFPKRLEVKLVEDDAYKEGVFEMSESSENRFLFKIYKRVLKDSIENPYSREASRVIVHEILHAADHPKLEKYHKLSTDLSSKLMDSWFEPDDLFNFEDLALLYTLRLLNRYRAEGLAELGEHLLTHEKFNVFPFAEQAFETFCKEFEKTLQEAQRIIKEHERDNIQNYSPVLTYDGAQVALLKALEKKDAVNHELANRALRGLETGQFKLTQDEALSIVRAAHSTSLEEYTQCLLHMNRFIGQAPEHLVKWSEKHE